MPADVSTPGPEDLDRRDAVVIPPFTAHERELLARYAPDTGGRIEAEQDPHLTSEQVDAIASQEGRFVNLQLGEVPPRTYDRSRVLNDEETELLRESKRLADELHAFILKLRAYPVPPRPLIAAVLQPTEPQTSIDPRWLSIAETHFQQGLMSINRAIAKPAQW